GSASMVSRDLKVAPVVGAPIVTLDEGGAVVVVVGATVVVVVIVVVVVGRVVVVVGASVVVVGATVVVVAGRTVVVVGCTVVGGAVVVDCSTAPAPGPSVTELTMAPDELRNDPPSESVFVDAPGSLSNTMPLVKSRRSTPFH